MYLVRDAHASHEASVALLIHELASDWVHANDRDHRRGLRSSDHLARSSDLAARSTCLPSSGRSTLRFATVAPLPSRVQTNSQPLATDRERPPMSPPPSSTSDVVLCECQRAPPRPPPVLRGDASTPVPGSIDGVQKLIRPPQTSSPSSSRPSASSSSAGVLVSRLVVPPLKIHAEHGIAMRGRR